MIVAGVLSERGRCRQHTDSIGWAPNSRVLDRCEEPLIDPPGEEAGRNMASVASLIHEGKHVSFCFFPVAPLRPVRSARRREGA